MAEVEVTIRTYRATYNFERVDRGEQIDWTPNQRLAEALHQLDSIRAELVQLIGADPKDTP